MKFIFYDESRQDASSTVVIRYRLWNCGCSAIRKYGHYHEEYCILNTPTMSINAWLESDEREVSSCAWYYWCDIPTSMIIERHLKRSMTKRAIIGPMTKMPARIISRNVNSRRFHRRDTCRCRKYLLYHDWAAGKMKPSADIDEAAEYWKYIDVRCHRRGRRLPFSRKLYENTKAMKVFIERVAHAVRGFDECELAKKTAINDGENMEILRALREKTLARDFTQKC